MVFFHTKPACMPHPAVSPTPPGQSSRRPPPSYPQVSHGPLCDAPTVATVLKITNIDAKHAVFRLFGVSLREKQEILFNKVYLLQEFSMTVTTQLVETITKGIQEKKGQDIVIVDLSQIDGAIAQYFIICQGGSPTQVEAIAESVGENCRKSMGEKPVGVNGLGNNQWVAIDFVDVLVHIFQPETRSFYNLEELWEDAKLTKIPNVD